MSNFFKKIKNIFKGKMFVAYSPKREKANKVIKYTLCIGLPLLGAVLGSTLGIREYNKNKIPETDIVVEMKKDQVNRRVYLISNDNYTNPLSVSLDKKATLQEQIMDVYNLLKVDSKLSNNYVKGFILEDIKMNKIEVKDNYAIVELLKFDEIYNIEDEGFKVNKITSKDTMTIIEVIDEN